MSSSSSIAVSRRELKAALMVHYGARLSRATAATARRRRGMARTMAEMQLGALKRKVLRDAEQGSKPGHIAMRPSEATPRRMTRVVKFWHDTLGKIRSKSRLVAARVAGSV